MMSLLLLLPFLLELYLIVPASLSSLFQVDCTMADGSLLATGTCNAQNCRGVDEMRQ